MKLRTTFSIETLPEVILIYEYKKIFEGISLLTILCLKRFVTVDVNLIRLLQMPIKTLKIEILLHNV
jgi:hypothetical protein